MISPHFPSSSQELCSFCHRAPPSQCQSHLDERSKFPNSTSVSLPDFKPHGFQSTLSAEIQRLCCSPQCTQVGKDSLLWSKDLQSHSCGKYSFAAVEANEVAEDQSQVETASNAIFVGIYDGHRSPRAAMFVNRRLFDNVVRSARRRGNVSAESLERAVSNTEEQFLNGVRQHHQSTPMSLVTGSCCLIGVIWKGTLLIGNLGDSRAVMGIVDGSDRIIAQQLTIDHNVNQEEIRQEVQGLHTNDPNILVYHDGRWRIKGILEVSRSIGDAYLKENEFLGPTLPEQYQFLGPLTRPAISATPFVYSRGIQPTDRFLIFASRGLWDHLTVQEAAEIVYKHSKKGIAKRLIKAAQKVAARKAEIKYRNLRKIDKGPRRDVHDDITVVVVFIDHRFLGKKIDNMQDMSVKGFSDSVERSLFRNIHDLM